MSPAYAFRSKMCRARRCIPWPPPPLCSATPATQQASPRCHRRSTSQRASRPRGELPRSPWLPVGLTERGGVELLRRRRLRRCTREGGLPVAAPGFIQPGGSPDHTARLAEDGRQKNTAQHTGTGTRYSTEKRPCCNNIFTLGHILPKMSVCLQFGQKTPTCGAWGSISAGLYVWVGGFARSLD
jgi:hypothetical protein